MFRTAFSQTSDTASMNRFTTENMNKFSTESMNRFSAVSETSETRVPSQNVDDIVAILNKKRY